MSKDKWLAACTELYSMQWTKIKQSITNNETKATRIGHFLFLKNALLDFKRKEFFNDNESFDNNSLLLCTSHYVLMVSFSNTQECQ